MNRLVEIITQQQAFKDALSYGIAVTIYADRRGSVTVTFSKGFFSTVRIFSVDACNTPDGMTVVQQELEKMYQNVRNAMEGVAR